MHTGVHRVGRGRAAVKCEIVSMNEAAQGRRGVKEAARAACFGLERLATERLPSAIVLPLWEEPASPEGAVFQTAHSMAFADR